MRKILLTTTALIALGSVSAVAADVSLSGNCVSVTTPGQTTTLRSWRKTTTQ